MSTILQFCLTGKSMKPLIHFKCKCSQYYYPWSNDFRIRYYKLYISCIGKSFLIRNIPVVVNSIIAFLLTFSPIAISLTMRKPEDKKEQINAIFLEATNRIARFLKKLHFSLSVASSKIVLQHRTYGDD